MEWIFPSISGFGIQKSDRSVDARHPVSDNHFPCVFDHSHLSQFTHESALFLYTRPQSAARSRCAQFLCLLQTLRPYSESRRGRNLLGFQIMFAFYRSIGLRRIPPTGPLAFVAYNSLAAVFTVGHRHCGVADTSRRCVGGPGWRVGWTGQSLKYSVQPFIMQPPVPKPKGRARKRGCESNLEIFGIWCSTAHTHAAAVIFDAPDLSSTSIAPRR